MTKCIFVITVLLDLVLSTHSPSKIFSKVRTTAQSLDAETREPVTPSPGFHWRYAAEYEWPGKMCKYGQGARQSPIDIITSAVKPDFAKHFIKHGALKFQGYRNVLLSGINNGHTLQFSTEGDLDMYPSLIGGPLKEHYRLEQLHFHWQSEHAINGNKFAMELHFVHIRDGLDVDQALKVPDGLAILAVFCNVLPAFGDKSAAVDDELMQHIPSLLTPGSKISGAMINMEKLLSSNRKDYYAYSGSLTSPECNEAVIWILFQKPIYITDELYRLFGKAGIGNNNFRSLQPVVDHKVYSVPHHEVTTPAIIVAFTQFTNFIKDFFLNITSFLRKGVREVDK